MDLAKLKVADLKAELAARNLDTKGVKAVLLERLKEALEREANAAGTAVNAGMGGEQQLFQAQHQQMMLQQQMFAQQQQQLYLQQQLQLQQEQQQLLLQQQQQQQQPLGLPQQNVIQSEVLPHQEAPPQQDAIEDLSMPSKRVETPVRRSRRRSATRSPSPTNSLGEHSTPAGALLGSARKRGRSRSMTKSPSPQRLAEVAPSLEAVQEEPEPPVVAPVERPVAYTQPEAVRQESAPVVDTFAAVAKEQPEQGLSEEIESVAAEPPCAMDTDVDSAHTILTESVNSEPGENQVHSGNVPDQLTVASGELSAAVTEEPSPLSEEQSSTVDTHSTEIDTKPEPDLEVKKAASVQEPSAEQEVKKEPEDNVKVEKEDDGNEKKSDAATEKTEATAAKDTNGGGSKQAKQSSEAGNKKQSQQNNVIEFVSEEIEPKLGDETDKQNATLSWYDSDLNLIISPEDLLSAKPLADGIFGLVWGGVRANFGVTGGRVFFEVLVGDEMQPATRSPFVPEGETCTPEIRIGWSIQPAASTPKRQLGESDRSYGYANDGQKVLGGTFEKYGGSYGKQDVIGAYLDLESQPCRIQYTLNRVRQGEAYEFDKDSLEGAALFPHIYTKNLAFKVNFGTIADGFPLTEKKVAEVKADEPEKQPADDATKAEGEEKESKEESSEDKEDSGATKAEETSAAAAVAKEEEQKEVVADSTDVDEKPTSEVTVDSVPFDAEYCFVNDFAKQNEELIVQGHEGPSSRDCCELIMMIGLPGSGKTHWVNKYLADNSETPYTVLSVNSLLDNMKISAQPRDPSNTPQWQKIVEQLSRNTGRLIEIACKRRRNILIDQTNVFASEQKRRLKGFGGFKVRRAIAVVPEVEEYKRRYEQKVAKYGKEVPDSTLNTMKANIFVPSDELKWYTEIVFAELPEAEAKEAIKKLNEEGRKLMPPRRNRGQQSNRGPNQKNNGSSNANSGYTSRWNHNHRAQGGSGGQYGGNKTGNRYGGSSGGGSGGYNNRYGNKSNDSHQYGGGGHHQQQHHHRGDYRSGGGNGYGRRDDHRSSGGYSGGGGGNRYDSWNRNSGGYYNDRGYSNRGYNQQQDHSNNRYDARRRDRRGYNNGSGWNSQGGQQQQQQQWNNNYSNSGSNDMWYDWWQSNLKTLLHEGGGQNGGNAAASSSSAYWNQYNSSNNASSSSYGGGGGGNYHAKGSGGSNN
ncbi:heterogeneous nuclear ribonucleoprotein U-like protein 1 isoform X1 [Anopheles darlingi]|uniref:heterogeneous nuclear ribonucleoprotein U-like protein 1 isoform X1 n=1 Tax=Anopheles darlingi TaxID=43151 RepID=UPI0021003D70|nr:heterogeneous nuclear ribonucleoprotein U-like protein 1 isoform X1 [Anopheles darlingi]